MREEVHSKCPRPSDDAHGLSSSSGRSRVLRHLISLNEVIPWPGETALRKGWESVSGCKEPRNKSNRKKEMGAEKEEAEKEEEEKEREEDERGEEISGREASTTHCPHCTCTAHSHKEVLTGGQLEDGSLPLRCGTQRRACVRTMELIEAEDESGGTSDRNLKCGAHC